MIYKDETDATMIEMYKQIQEVARIQIVHLEHVKTECERAIAQFEKRKRGERCLH